MTQAKTRLSVLPTDPTRHALQRWHAVARARSVRKKPVAVKVHDRDIVLFRDSAGDLAAVEDACPHRRAKLSAGKVVGGELICSYHLAAINRHGRATKPATPEWKACVPRYDVVERGGIVWVKSPGHEAKLPRTEFPGFVRVGVITSTWDAPVALVLDNMAELEHSIVVHPTFGTDLPSIEHSEHTMELSPTQVTTHFTCAQKRWPRIAHLLTGVEAGDRFVDTWTVEFDPLVATFHISWEDRVTGKKRPLEFYAVLSFTPVTAERTYITATMYSSKSLRVPRFIQVLNTHILQRLELHCDKKIVDAVPNDTELSDMKLGRFDRSLVEIRKRLSRVYFGTDSSARAREVVNDNRDQQREETAKADAC